MIFLHIWMPNVQRFSVGESTEKRIPLRYEVEQPVSKDILRWDLKRMDGNFVEWVFMSIFRLDV